MHNYLTINGQGFRPPNSVQTENADVSYQTKWDGMDGTTNFHKIITGTKKVKKLNFQILDRFEFEFIQDFVNNGFWSVELEMTGHSFSGNYLIEFTGFEDGFSGTKSNIVLTLTPQNVE